MGLAMEDLDPSEKRLDCGKSNTTLRWPIIQVGVLQVRLATLRTCSPSQEKTIALPR